MQDLLGPLDSVAACSTDDAVFAAAFIYADDSYLQYNVEPEIDGQIHRDAKYVGRGMCLMMELGGPLRWWYSNFSSFCDYWKHREELDDLLEELEPKEAVVFEKFNELRSQW